MSMNELFILFPVGCLVTALLLCTFYSTSKDRLKLDFNEAIQLLLVLVGGIGLSLIGGVIFYTLGEILFWSFIYEAPRSLR